MQTAPFLAPTALAAPNRSLQPPAASPLPAPSRARAAKHSRTRRALEPAGPTANERAAARLGYPATLFGLTPNDQAYWHEPGLPWFTSEMYNTPPLTYVGLPNIPHFGFIEGNKMGPRFPHGCGVNTMPVYDRKNLVVGRVYIYHFQDAATGERAAQIGRLVAIGGNYLEVQADNDPTPALWVLQADEREAVWDVWEVTHYASYPDLD